MCGSCARRLCVTLFGNQEEEFHFCTEHEGDAPAYKNQAPDAEVFSFEYPPEPTLEDAPHMCNVCKIDVRRLHEFESKLYPNYSEPRCTRPKGAHQTPR